MAGRRSGSRFSIYGEFRLLDRFTRPLERIERRTSGAAGRINRLAGNLNYFGRSLGPVFAAAGVAVAGALAGIAAALRDVIDTGLEFDRTMATTLSRFNVAAGSEEAAALQHRALDAGARVEGGARAAAEALGELGGSGTSVADAIAGLDTIINYATASGMEMGHTADLLTDSMANFGLQTDDAATNAANMTHIADVLTYSAGAAGHTNQELADALQNVAQNAHEANQSIETTTSMLTAMAEGGLKGSEAGTALSRMFDNLRTPTQQGARALQRLHVEVRNQDGSMRNGIDIVRDFARATEGMSDAARDTQIARIFGVEGRRAIGTLMAQLPKLEQVQAAMANVAGESERVARQMGDSAAGDMMRFDATIESIKLGIWELIRGPYRSVIQATTEWMRANQALLTSGLQEGIAWLQAHLPEIEYWGLRIGLAFLILLSPILLAMAVMVIASVLFIGLLVLIVAAVIGLVVAIILAAEWVYELGVTIWDSMSAAWDAVSGFVTAAQEFLVGLWVIVSGAAMRYLRPVFDLFSRAAARVREAWAPIGSWFANIWAGVSKAVAGVWGSIMGQARAAYAEFIGIWGHVTTFFSALWASIAGSFQNTIGGILDRVGSVIGAVREEGRAELDREASGGGPRGERQLVTPQERLAREVSDTTTTERAEVVIRDDTGRAEVRRPPRGHQGRIRLQASGAM